MIDLLILAWTSGFSVSGVVLGAFSIYALSIMLFLVMDNRSPQSTFAWLFLMVIFPALGVLVYYFFGRGRKVFSQESKLVMQEVGGQLTEKLQPLADREEAIIERMEREEHVSYKHKLLQLVRRNSNSVLTVHNKAKILQNADEKYPALIEDIRGAETFIHMEYYEWDADKFTDRLKDLLIEKVKQGVEVRILYDPIGALKLSWKYLREIRAGGVKMQPYLNYSSIFKLHAIGYRNHRKIVVLDGRVGYIGGLNMGQGYLDGGDYFDSWRDTHLRIEGEAVSVLQAIFVTSWYNTTKEDLSDGRYFPVATEEELAADDYLPLQITTSGPDSQWAAIRQLYFAMILAAEERVYIQSPFFIPDDSISEALKAAALAGVDVRLMFAPRGATYSLPYAAANTYFKDMAEAGIHIYLYEAGYFHPKTIMIDGEVCCVGTANMDIRSFMINYEASAVIYDRDLAAELEQDFRDDMAQCSEFDLAAYERRNIFVRLRDSLARLFSPLL